MVRIHVLEEEKLSKAARVDAFLSFTWTSMHTHSHGGVVNTPPTFRVSMGACCFKDRPAKVALPRQNSYFDLGVSLFIVSFVMNILKFRTSLFRLALTVIYAEEEEEDVIQSDLLHDTSIEIQHTSRAHVVSLEDMYGVMQSGALLASSMQRSYMRDEDFEDVDDAAVALEEDVANNDLMDSGLRALQRMREEREQNAIPAVEDVFLTPVPVASSESERDVTNDANDTSGAKEVEDENEGIARLEATEDGAELHVGDTFFEDITSTPLADDSLASRSIAFDDLPDL